MSLETIRISKQGRDQLITLRRRTGITNWNVLCRWAFCLSVTEPSPPRHEKVPADSPVEMSWHTFGGENESVYMALLKQRCRKDGMDVSSETLATQFRLHLHRGIGYLAGDPNLKGITDLIRKATASKAADA
jgi:DNA sulfur modification protein DndE